MGKYFCIVDGEALDWKFTRLREKDGTPLKEHIWNFHLGETYIGQVFKLKSGWAPAPFHTPCPFGGVDGFATRYHAAEYMLKVCGFIKRSDQLHAERMEKLGFVSLEFETYTEFLNLIKKLEAAEAKLAAAYARGEMLESQLSWVDIPERMGS